MVHFFSKKQKDIVHLCLINYFIITSKVTNPPRKGHVHVYTTVSLHSLVKHKLYINSDASRKEVDALHRSNDHLKS